MNATTYPALAIAVWVAVFAFFSGGCSSTGGGPFGWWTSRGERAADKAQARLTVAEADLLARAQRNVEEFMAAVRLAPPSRPVAVAIEAGKQASGHLGQLLGPVTAERLAQIEQRASALVSEDAATRAPAEAARAADRKEDYAAAEQVGELRAKLDAAEGRAREIAAKNAETAAVYLWTRFAAIAGAIASTVLTIAVFALKKNLFGVTSAAGEIVGTMRAKYGARDEDVQAITGMLDAPTTPAQQKTIASLAAQAAQAFLAAKATTSN